MVGQQYHLEVYNPVDANGVPTNPGAVTYPTNCGLSLGTAQLITTGSEAGKYFRASGRLNQVTVVDTRNVDAGWTLQGAMTDFSSTTSALSRATSTAWSTEMPTSAA